MVNKLFNDTIIIANVGTRSPFVKHIPNDKYNVSEDLSLKIKEIFSGKNCNVLYGGTINEQNCIGLYGSEEFRKSDILDLFYTYLMENSNYYELIINLQNDLYGYGRTELDGNQLRFIPDNYAIDGKSIVEADRGAVKLVLRKYSDVFYFEEKIDEYDSGDILIITVIPALKQQRIIPKDKSEITYTTEQLRQIIINKLNKDYTAKFVVNELKDSVNEFCISFEPVDLGWTPNLEYIADFKSQYGYEPDSSDMYYDYDYIKYNNLQLQIENILGDLFEVSEWEVSTEYQFVECVVKFKNQK